MAIGKVRNDPGRGDPHSFFVGWWDEASGGRSAVGPVLRARGTDQARDADWAANDAPKKRAGVGSYIDGGYGYRSNKTSTATFANRLLRRGGRTRDRIGSRSLWGGAGTPGLAKRNMLRRRARGEADPGLRGLGLPGGRSGFHLAPGILSARLRWDDTGPDNLPADSSSSTVTASSERSTLQLVKGNGASGGSRYGVRLGEAATSQPGPTPVPARGAGLRLTEPMGPTNRGGPGLPRTSTGRGRSRPP